MPVMGMDDRVFVSLEHDPTVSVIAISVATQGGMVDIRAGEQGVPHLREHLVARHGTFRGMPIRRVLSAMGGVIQASTHPFHTEYQVVLPTDVEGDAAVVVAELARYWSAVGRQHFGPGEVEAEILSIDRELDERLLRGMSALFPWTEIFNTLAPERSPGDNLLLDGPTDVDAAVRALSAFEDRARSLSTTISIVGPIPVERIAHELRETGFSMIAAVPHLFAPSDDVRFAASRTIVRRVHGVRNAVHAAAYPIGARMPDRSAAQAVAAVTAGTLNRVVVDGRWQAGAFGPFAGPDSGILIYSGRSPFARAEVPLSMDGAAVDRARADALSELRMMRSAPSVRARQWTMGALFGTSPEKIARAIEEVTDRHVVETLAAMGGGRTGHLAWLPSDE